MKKNKKCKILLFSLLLLLVLFPIKVQALTNIESDYFSIYDVANIDSDAISFNNISHIYNDDGSIGVKGNVINHANTTLNYILTIKYYDEYHLSIFETSNSATASIGSNEFEFNNLPFHNIKYYKVVISLENNVNIKPSNLYSNGYAIDDYDVDIIVNEDNTFDITEKITAYFKDSRHGIIRTIPFSNKITRLDGTTSKNRANLSDLNVNESYKLTKENGNYKIKIGSANQTLTGEQKYIIKYKYNIGKDPLKDKDELYFNIIGNEWDTVIGGVDFTITMPKKFDATKLGFSVGTKGSTSNSGISYDIVDNKITGKYNGILKAREGITVRTDLEEGYFVGAKSSIDINDYIIYIYPVIFFIIIYILWYIYGRDEQVIETVEFYPPEGFNSLEIGYLYKGKATNKDVTSLLIYLANKGYIKITPTKEKVLFMNKEGFKITKLKEYDGNNANEEAFLNGLFNLRTAHSSLFTFVKNNVTENTERIVLAEVTSEQLRDRFYITMNSILHKINSKDNFNKIITKKKGITFLCVILILISNFLILVKPFIYYDINSNSNAAFILSSIGLFILFPTFILPNQFIEGKIAARVIGLFFYVPILILVIIPILANDIIYAILYIFGILCIFGMFVCFLNLPKRTKYGNEILGKINGFKTFLQVAEKDKLEALVEKNPTYFYDILPYTYVLGVSDKWIKKFEQISIQSPSWYDGTDNFNVHSFGTFMNTTMSKAQSAMTSSPSSGDSSSGGSSSGGGSSGGGSGGGGGSSW